MYTTGERVGTRRLDKKKLKSKEKRKKRDTYQIGRCDSSCSVYIGTYARACGNGGKKIIRPVKYLCMHCNILL